MPIDARLLRKCLFMALSGVRKDLRLEAPGFHLHCQTKLSVSDQPINVVQVNQALLLSSTSKCRGAVGSVLRGAGFI